MIGISDTGVIQIKNLITGVETQFTGPVDQGLIPAGDYGAAYNFQNEVYASNNNGDGMIWIDWKTLIMKINHTNSKRFHKNTDNEP